MTRLSGIVLGGMKRECYPSPEYYYGLLSRIRIDGLTTLYAHNVGLHWDDPYLQARNQDVPVTIQKAYPPGLHQILDDEIITFAERESGTPLSREVIDARLTKHIIEDVKHETKWGCNDVNAFYLSELQRNTLGWCYVLSMYVIDQKKT